MVLSWMGLIFYLSSMNTNESNTKSKNTINQVIETTVNTTNNIGITDKHPTETKKQVLTELLNKPLRKVAHASVYFVLAILLMYTLLITNHNQHKKLLLTMILSILICFLYAITDEYHQTFVKGRTGQFSDVLIDTIGASIASSLAALTYVKIRRKRRKNAKKFQSNISIQ